MEKEDSAEYSALMETAYAHRTVQTTMDTKEYRPVAPTTGSSRTPIALGTFPPYNYNVNDDDTSKLLKHMLSMRK